MVRIKLFQVIFQKFKNFSSFFRTDLPPSQFMMNLHLLIYREFHMSSSLPTTYNVSISDISLFSPQPQLLQFAYEIIFL